MIITDLKQVGKQVCASFLIFIIVLTSILMFMPLIKIESSANDGVVNLAKEPQRTTLDKEVKEVTSRNQAKRVVEKKETFVIYELSINKEKQIYFETFGKAKYQKDYLVRNTVDISAEISEIKKDNTDCLSTEFEINNTIENYILKYKKKTQRQQTTNRKTRIVQTEDKSDTTKKTCYPTISKRVSSHYGKRTRGFHTGIDISGNYGDNIFAYKSGTVSKVQYSNKSYGNMVLITHEDGSQTRYAHMSSIDVVNGQHVICGQTIGHVGSTGNSTGNHLHFEIIINGKTVNPYNYIF